MYTCCMCKKTMNGEASLKNVAGSFCHECKEIIRNKIAAGMRSRRPTMDGSCIWCGEEITSATRKKSKPNENVCQPCSTNRDWLLKCIRTSDRPARYVSRIEERERPIREKREQEKREQPVQETVKTTDEADARLIRLEMMMNKLMLELGV